MKTTFLMLLVLCSGCATTSMRVRTSDGLVVDFRFPKNMEAKKLDVKVGDHHLKAEYLRTDASGVVKEQVVGVKAVADTAGEAIKIIPSL